MSDNLYRIEARIRRYERQAERRDKVVFWGVMICAGILFALGAW